MLAITLTGAILSWMIAQKIIERKMSFEIEVERRFLKTIEFMKSQPVNNNNTTFGLKNITKTDYGFYANLIIPIGLSEDDFIKIIPILENSFKSEIEYKNYYIKFINKRQEGVILC